MKDIKVDLILFNNQLSTVFSCEYMPSDVIEANVQVDMKKTKKLYEKHLLYI